MSPNKWYHHCAGQAVEEHNPGFKPRRVQYTEGLSSHQAATKAFCARQEGF